MYQSQRVAACAILASLLASGTAGAFQVSGMVDTAENRPVAAAMVTVTASNSKMGADTVTVFTGSDGKYTTPDLGSGVTEADIQRVTARRVGFVATDPDQKVMVPTGIQINFVMAPTENVARQVSPSNWLDSLNLPNDLVRQRA